MNTLKNFKVGDTIVVVRDITQFDRVHVLTLLKNEEYKICEIYQYGSKTPYWFAIIDKYGHKQSFISEVIDNKSKFHIFDSLKQIRINKIESLKK